MTIYFSAATCSFYNTDVYPENNLPEDCVIVEEETYKNLMAQQNAGFVIVSDSDGNPSVMSQSCGSCHCTVHEKTVATADQLGHVKVDGTNIAVNESGEITLPVLEGYVDKTSAQTITGVKTFTDSPLVPTADAASNDTTAASTAFVKNATSVKADTSLSNLDETGQAVIDGKQDIATAVNYDNITNCITSIPQDIKLELNNGTLTLKAGSKVYALDGSSYTIPSDVTISYSNTTAHSSWILVKENGEMFDIWTTESASSISIGSKWVTFRETNCYLPICLATHNADGTTKTGWKSIDQVFNGFGYIGSTVFALPGVKGLIPNGRNADGTLKNIEFTTTSVLTQTIPAEWGNPTFFAVDNYGFSAYAQYSEDGFVNGFGNQMWYDSRENLLKATGDNLVNIDVIKRVYFLRINHDSGRITSFAPKTVFRALDYADKNIPVLPIPATSGTVTLADNTIYSGAMTGAMTFVLPTVTDAITYHQIKAMLYLPVVTIDWGTTHYIGGEAPDISEAGQYMIYWDYVPALSAWAVGAMKVG